MAVYSRLLLSTGGGIISTQQQAEQTENTSTIFIGLGGTGVDCIRTIKTQVYTRLKPDDENAVVPTYQHIRFIGVDSTEKTRGCVLVGEKADDEVKKADAIMSLDDTEFFSIGNKDIESVFDNKLALKKRKELSWLEHENIVLPHLTEAGAGGIRQVGRFMMMDKSQEFMVKVKEEINAARLGLPSPRVDVHVFSGLSGGTGSGCFLDVCYMIRSIAKTIPGVTVFGYFFLPDVNLSRIPHADGSVHEFIKQNGYASMQELDYCMRLEKNGGCFEQVYKGHKDIKWERAPVDMCHLICATDKHGAVIPNAYNYAMNVTAEYVMDFLTQTTSDFGLSEHLSNFVAKVDVADNKKTIGSEMAYCVIGASCATIPLREINTYLASELFNKFGAISINTPTKADVEIFAISALALDAQSIGGIYESLLNHEMREGATGEYSQYLDDWKFVQEYGNGKLVENYTNQTGTQLNRAESNAQSMMDSGNNESLLGRLQTRLEDIIRDFQRGPIYAYKMLDASKSHNFLNVIDGLIEENTFRWNQEAAQTELRESDYDQAKSDFENHRKRNLFDNSAKRFNDYEYYLMLLEQHRLTMNIYNKLDTVLRKFKEQVEGVTATYYIKLNRVMSTLIETFAENRNALADQETLHANGSFAIPMMTIEELKPSLDAKIEEINIPGMLNSFMNLLLDKEEDWIEEDENRISRLVIKFFVETAFHDFADKTITSFLRDKYENKFGGKVSDAQLTKYIYDDWMKRLTEKASPLFHFNNGIWSEAETSKLAFLSFPSVSSPVKTAAQQMNQTNKLWGLKDSALTDRIFVMSSACGLPLSSYKNCTEYQWVFFASKKAGRHYYEGKPNPSIKFTDWNKLPSVIPQSIIDVEDAPLDLAELIKEARGLYAKARKYEVIDDDSYICEPSAESIAAINEICDICENQLASTSKPEDIPVLDETVNNLKKHETLEMVKTSFSFPPDGLRKEKETILSIQQDYFVSSPAIHEKVASIISEIESVLSRKADIISAAKNTIADIREEGNTVSDYCEAIFTGVISIEGRIVVYRQNNYGIVTETILSKRGEEFIFGSIPLYQGFVSYQELPEETRNEIKNLANDRINADAPELYSVGKILKDQLGEDRVNAWVQTAANFEQRMDIIAFIGELNRHFDTYCMENGI